MYSLFWWLSHHLHIHLFHRGSADTTPGETVALSGDPGWPHFCMHLALQGRSVPFCMASSLSMEPDLGWCSTQ